MLPQRLIWSTFTYLDISAFVAGFGANLRCNFDEGEKILRHEIDTFIIGTTDVLNNLRQRINPIPMIKVREWDTLYSVRVCVRQTCDYMVKDRWYSLRSSNTHVFDIAAIAVFALYFHV